jgi:hypothetical protein
MSTAAQVGRPGDPPILPPIVKRGLLSRPVNGDGKEHGSMPLRPWRSPERARSIPRHRFLPPGEWVLFARGLGALHDSEQHQPVHPSHWWWPPKGMMRGLYKDVVWERTVSFYLYHGASTVRWVLMVLQLFIGATLTALGPQALLDGTAVTVLGAVNTVVAGLLALLHNSGLPDRYRHNMVEFEAVEDHIRETLDTSLVPADYAIDQVLAECFDMFQRVKSTVTANLPMTYTPSQALQTYRQKGGRAGQGQLSLEKMVHSTPAGGSVGGGTYIPVPVEETAPTMTAK